MLVPYSTYQVVAWPFGLTVPVTVAVVGPTEVTGPVIAAGTAAAVAPPAADQASTIVATRTRDAEKSADAAALRVRCHGSSTQPW